MMMILLHGSCVKPLKKKQILSSKKNSGRNMKLTKKEKADCQIRLGSSLLASCGLLFCILFWLTGCASHQYAQKIEPTAIQQAEQEIPEQELMDIGIVAFKEGEITEKQIEKEGVNPDIRKAEIYYIPFHLKNTLQQSGHWGAVWVMPSEIDGLDLAITGEVLESNGKRLVIQIAVADAMGQVWLDRTYRADASAASYKDNVMGVKDAYQDLYNTIANDIAALKQKRTTDDIERLRTVSKLKFSQDVAPDAFGPYLVKNKDGIYAINRLPADTDSIMERTLQIREREYMFFDTLNAHYESFYTQMWPDYLNWRKSDRIERVALAKMKRDAFIRKAGGVLLIALAVAVDVAGSANTGALESAMVLGGGKIFYDGMNISQQAKIHSEAIKELGDSFGNEMKPVVLEFEGKKYELTGSAAEQFNKWRALLRKIYYTETGFIDDTAETDLPPDQ
jgi:hypothetical protein